MKLPSLNSLLVGAWLGMAYGAVVAPGAEAVWVSSLDLTRARQSWGEAHADRSVAGNPLSIAGRKFERGVGTHSFGRLVVYLREQAESFSAWTGLDDEIAGNPATVVFKVLADDKEVWSSGVMRPGDAAKRVDVDLRRVRVLTLIVEDAGDGYAFDHADWADAKISMTSGRPVTIVPRKARQLAAMETPKQFWSLTSGAVEYRLRQTDFGVDCAYFGPKDGAPAGRLLDYRPDVNGRVEGRELRAEDLRLGDVTTNDAGGVRRLGMTFRHRLLPLEVQVRYAAWDDTGVFTRQTTLSNTGTNLVHLEFVPSLAWLLPEGKYELTTLHGGWGQERQPITEALEADPKTFESTSGRSSSRLSPWLSLRNESTGLRYLAQLAWSGNWTMDLRREGTNVATLADEELRVRLGARFDHGGPLLLHPGAAVDLPEVAFTVTRGDLDDAANALHRYQRRFVVPASPANQPPLVQFNTWYACSDRLNLNDLKRYADAAAALGAEVFVVDAGWFSRERWDLELGDWRANAAVFPKGTAELADWVHGKGLRFGMWLEIENLGDQSEAFRQRGDWCLQQNGRPIVSSRRAQLDFARPEVRAWARSVVDRLVRENRLDWLKLDYNIDVGERMEAADGTRPGGFLLHHVQGYYRWLDELRAAYPELILENCSSGGLRFDLGMLAHTHTTWISDRTLPKPSLQLAFGSTLEFTPQVCNHWMVGDDENGSVQLSAPAGWWDFLFRVPMNGQFGLSSRVLEWNEDLRQCAQRNIALYKRIRPVVAGGDCYHLTAPPARENPEGWMALEYADPGRQRAVLLAYRLAQGSPSSTFRLRGLADSRKYRWSLDGQPRGEMLGEALGRQGIEVRLPEEWRAAVFEFEAVR